MLPITVSCPVYCKVPAEHFAVALESVYTQTMLPAEVLIVADGPLTSELDAVIAGFEARYPDITVVERLPENVGLAHVMQHILKVSTQPWIARQDADDISLPHRLERMWERLSQGNIAALGAAMYEFEGDPENIVGVRSMPLSKAAVRRYARFNTPVSNPTSILHRDTAVEVGGVRPLQFIEDFDLLARLIAAGHAVENLPDALVYFRADPGMFARRRDRRLFRAEWQMQKNLRRYGLISTPRMLLNYVVRAGVRLIPPSWFKALYSVVFRRRKPDAV